MNEQIDFSSDYEGLIGQLYDLVAIIDLALADDTEKTARAREKQANNVTKSRQSVTSSQGSHVEKSREENSKRIEEESREEPPTTPTPIHSQDFVTLYQSFEQEIGRPLSPIQQQELGYMLEDFSPDLIQESLREAVSQGKANFAYIKAILNRWKSDNLLTVELVRNSKQSRTGAEEPKQPMSYENWQPTAENPF